MPETSAMRRLPARDLWLLPLVSLLTVLMMLAGAEVISRFFWPAQKVNSCVIPDGSLGFRYRPNCSSTMKTVEGPWYTNTYNECGYRSAASCGVVPTGTRRIALVGTSISEGYLVEYPHTIGARLGVELTTMCRAPVEIQNLAAIGYTGRRLYLRMEEALSIHPDAVLLVVLPFDVLEQVPENGIPVTATAATLQSKRSLGLQERVVKWISESRAAVVAQHFLFENPSVYLPLYLRYGDKADFLRPPFTAAWTERLRNFDILIAKLSVLSHAAGVPFMLAFVPNQAEVTLMANGSSLKGIDPTALPKAIGDIARRHDVIFTDTSQELRLIPKPASLYYQVDGHPSGTGQPIIAQTIAQRFASLTNGPFADCRLANPSGQVEVQ